MDLLNEVSRLKSIAIVGGTFNPVHKGHIMLGEFALKTLPFLDYVVYMPNNKPVYKDNGKIVSGYDRIKMLELALSNSKMTVSDMEIKRGGITYTIDTLRLLKRYNSNVDIYLVIGGDSLVSFDSWKEYVEILKISKLLVAKRRGSDYNLEKYEKKLKKVCDEAEIKYMDSPFFDISSTVLREQFSKGIYDTSLVPESVIDYIRINGMYRK